MKILNIFSFLVLLTLAVFAQPTSDIHVLSESQSSLTIEFVPEYQISSIITVDRIELTDISFRNSVKDPTKTGEILIRFRDVPLVLRSTQYTIEVINADYEERQSIIPAFKPIYKGLKDFGAFPEYNTSMMKSVSAEVIPVSQARIENRGYARGFTFGVLKLYPVQFYPKRKTAKLCTRMVVRISFKEPFLDYRQSTILLNVAELGPQKGKNVISLSKSVEQPPLSTGDWYKIEVEKEGIYKLDYNYFAKAGITITNINSIRIFGNGGEPIQEDLNLASRNGLEEISRLVVDENSNGVFDPNDFILFYGKSTTGWKYNTASPSFYHYGNPYSDKNYYFLTYGGIDGKPMTTIASESADSAIAVKECRGMIFYEQSKYNLLRSGTQWLGQQFDKESNTYIVANSLSGLLASSSKAITYRIQFLTRSTTIDEFRVYEDGVLLGNPITTGTTVIDNIEGDYAFKAPVTTYIRQADLKENRSVLKMVFGTSNIAAKGWLDWFEILYPRALESSGDFLNFFAPLDSIKQEFTISNLSSRDVYVFDVTNHQNVKRVINLQFDPANSSVVTFRLRGNATTPLQYSVIGATGYFTPIKISRVSNSNVKGITEGANLVIISPPEFLDEARRLQAHKQSLKGDSLKTIVINMEHIQNEFGSGIADPLSIRDMLYFARKNWLTVPSYVLLFGSGHFDYRNILNPKRNFVPVYETEESIHQIFSLTSDDYLVKLVPNSPTITMSVGRIAANNIKEAKLAVDRIIFYETQLPFGSWRNKITYVADDGKTSTKDDGSIHTSQADALATSYTPTHIEKKKIYIVEYPSIYTAAGTRKPDANKAIIDAVNNGTLMLNWTGHGNPEVWAHEWVFTREGTIPQFSNSDKPTFFIAATCDFSRFDDPYEQSSGEKITLVENGGAIGILGTTRAVYSNENADLNEKFYSHLLYPKDGLGRPPRLGDAIWTLKQVMYTEGPQKFNLLGDPTLRLAIPTDSVYVDSINGVSGKNRVVLKALGKTVLKGSIKHSGSGNTNYIGKAQVEVFDSKKIVNVSEWNFNYELQGSLLYRGNVSVNNGKFTTEFPIPKDISYNQNSARIAIYSSDSTTDGIGVTENLVIIDTDSLAARDTTGPVISCYFNDTNFKPGDIVFPQAILIVKLSDTSGINTSSAGIGHKLEATFSFNEKPIDLTDFYQSQLNTYRSGEARYRTTQMPEGRHKVKVKAWDIYNNSTLIEFPFEVRSTSEMAIFNLLNVPNPFSTTTKFTFQRTSTEPVLVEIKIYSIYGRLLQNLEIPVTIDRSIQIGWDGRDREGNEVANGVYFYKVVLKSLDRTKTVESIGKMAIVR